MHFDGEAVHFNPSFPKHWESVELPVILRGGSFRLHITRNEITVHAAEGNTAEVTFALSSGQREVCRPGAKLTLRAESAVV
jgi:trehalose/maltose hydrolase-like predicted phosphorylase